MHAMYVCSPAVASVVLSLNFLACSWSRYRRKDTHAHGHDEIFICCMGMQCTPKQHIFAGDGGNVTTVSSSFQSVNIYFMSLNIRFPPHTAV